MDDVSDDTCDFENDDTHWNGKMEKKEREKQGREYISLYHANFVLQKKVRVNAKISLSWKKKNGSREKLYITSLR